MTKILAVLLLVGSKLLLFAQWNSDPAINTPICTEVGKQIEHRITSDNLNGAFITWKDYRTGVPDIYIQHINSAGVTQWTTNGIGLCTDFNDQSTPAITTDMNGGAIVTWSDWRSGIERDIYAQRINDQGIIQWTYDGAIVTNKSEREHSEKIISDDQGGAIIFWEQQSSLTGQWDIWGQRINSSGIALWPDGGIPVCTIDANRVNPKVQRDGKGGAIITWQDYRSFMDYDIYAQRMSPTGNRLWGNSGIAVCTSENAQMDPKIDPDTIKGGAYITWIDKRNGIDYDIYAQRLDSLGVPQWVTNGISVCTYSGNQSAQDMLSGYSVDGLIITWKDKRSGDYDIYAQRLNTSGIPQWSPNGIAVCNNLRDQINPNISEDLNGGAIIVWQDSTSIDTDIKAQRIGPNGALLWQTYGVNVGSATGTQGDPKSVSDGLGGSIFVFRDKRSGSNDIYAHHLYSNGTTISDIGLYEYTLSEINCYPNPFFDRINLNVDCSINDKIVLTMEDVLGNEVPIKVISITKTDSKRNYVLEMASSEISSGIYVLKIDGNNSTKSIRIVKH